MKHIYLVHGLMLGLLKEFGTNATNLWMAPARLSACQFEGLMLAPDGDNPYPGVGVPLRSAGLWRTMHLTTINALHAAEEKEGWKLTEHGYDWRKLQNLQGELLANRIRGELAPGDTAVLVTHSNGGFVARWAYYFLSQWGLADLVERVIFIGCPHKGSWNAPLLWTGQSDAARGLARIKNIVGTVWQGIVPIARPTLWTVERVIRVFATFPSVYGLMPFYEEEDPYTQDLWEASRYPSEINVSQEWLNYVKNTLHPAMKSPSLMPPRNKVVNVYATCSYTIQSPYINSLLGAPTRSLRYEQGDGVVGVSSAIIPNYFNYRADFYHDSVMNSPTIGGEIANVIKMPIPAQNPEEPPYMPYHGQDVTGSIPNPDYQVIILERR